MGRSPAREDIPCTTCIHYKTMQQDARWLTSREVKGPGRFERLIAWAGKTEGLPFLRTLLNQGTLGWRALTRSRRHNA